LRGRAEAEDARFRIVGDVATREAIPKRRAAAVKRVAGILAALCSEDHPMKRPAFLILLFVWLGLLFGIAFALPSARSAEPPAETVPLAWVGEALDGMPFILSGRR